MITNVKSININVTVQVVNVTQSILSRQPTTSTYFSFLQTGTAVRSGCTPGRITPLRSPTPDSVPVVEPTEALLLDELSPSGHPVEETVAPLS
jgi:hypothetical protein